MRFHRWLQPAVLCATLVACGTSGSNGPSGLPSSPGNPSTPASSGYIVLTTPSNSIEAGKTVQLKATFYDGGVPSNDQRVTWASNNAAAARVDATGLVTGVAAGTATITVTSLARTSVSSNAVITVTAPVPPFVGTIFVGVEREPFPGGPTSYEIVAVDPNTGAETKLTTDRFSNTLPSPSPDGQYIWFFSNRLVANGEFLIMKRDGSSVQQLYSCVYNNGSLGFPYCVTPKRWLPDSRLMYLVDDIDAQFRSVRGLYFRNPATQATQVTAFPTTASDASLVSPAGDLAVYAGSGGSLTSVRLSDGPTTQIAPACSFPTTCRFLTWAPAGTVIYAARDGAIVQIAIDGSGQTKLYAATTGEFGAMLASPDGNYLAFVEGTAFRLLKLGPSPTVRTLLSAAPDQIAWSPNSASLAFRTVNAEYQDQVTIMNVDGTGQRNVASTRLLQGLSWGK